MDAAERERVLEALGRQYTRAVSVADPGRLDVWEELGLTMSQLRVLFILNRDSGMTAGRLAKRLGVRPSTVTGIVDRLARQSLVLRRADPEDRRVVRNFLTPTGVEVVSDFDRAGRTQINRILTELADGEIEELLEGLTAFNARAEAVGLLMPMEAPASSAEAP